ncbi:MAG TPA: YaaL family protein [Candidatus Dormibacteraeota bacterium]|nr:YaaL family protein [Candidatus Dormibacteraeota bacterium]
MKKRLKKREIDEHLLNTINKLRDEWQQIQSIVEKSIDPADSSVYQQSLARAKYLFLLREARHRNLSAKRHR